MSYHPDEADSVAAEQIRYWRRMGLTAADMIEAIGFASPEHVSPDDVHHTLAGWWIWERKRLDTTAAPS